MVYIQYKQLKIKRNLLAYSHIYNTLSYSHIHKDIQCTKNVKTEKSENHITTEQL